MNLADYLFDYDYEILIRNVFVSFVLPNSVQREGISKSSLPPYIPEIGDRG